MTDGRPAAPGADPPPIASRQLACGEMAAGHRRTATSFALPGLAAWVHSTPAGAGDAGGDVHYISVCDSCLVSRVALADVSGHGQAVAALGATLRGLMERYLTQLAQVGLMRDLNDAVRRELDQVHYATMVAVGFHARRRLLVMTNAGHPPPLWYRTARREWVWLDPARRGGRARLAGVTLGLLEQIDYDRHVVRPQPGDIVVLYSDGVSEATSLAGDELGRDRLMALARGLDRSSAASFGTQLITALAEFRGQAPPADDHTVIVLRAT
jgi:sigma-B regulation protein RsbU (phosphoserine phosphatase)